MQSNYRIKRKRKKRPTVVWLPTVADGQRCSIVGRLFWPRAVDDLDFIAMGNAGQDGIIVQCEPGRKQGRKIKITLGKKKGISQKKRCEIVIWHLFETRSAALHIV